MLTYVMINPIHQKWAKLLVNYCTDVQAGENVSINVDMASAAIARAIFREVLKKEANPILHIDYPEMSLDVLELAADSFFEEEASIELNEIKQIDSWIRVRAPENTSMLQNADKSKLSMLAKKYRPIQNIRINETKWVGSLFPSNALAQDAGMSLEEYENFVYGSMFLFDDDPVQKWQEVHDFQEKLINRLKRAKEVHIVAENTDLKLAVTGRTWLNSDGHRNMPSGEVFTGPIEDSAEGYIRFGIPSSVSGVEVQNIDLVFEKGKVVKAKAEKGDDLLKSLLDTDAGSRFLGELGIGTNYQIQKPSKQILFDEKIGGTIHLAVGQSYKESGGTNQSAIHWDMICDLRQAGAIYLDGELFQENGEFKI